MIMICLKGYKNFMNVFICTVSGNPTDRKTHKHTDGKTGENFTAASLAWVMTSTTASM